MLVRYASDPARGQNRLHKERESRYRTGFQRDRDRIVHSSAFRRLKHKTQVFVEHEGDYFRTRLTHSIEVAQVARTLAGALRLNIDLAETVALAHDLGHPPFGHTGEDALADLMKPYGGFDHNAQAIKIVTHLERHYAAFDGLNLTWDSLEGIAKHNGPVSAPVPYGLAQYNEKHDLALTSYASAEAQIAALSDDIAYNHHDLLDGLRAGLFALEDIATLPILRDCLADVDKHYPRLDPYRRRHEALRRFFGRLVDDVMVETKSRLDILMPQSVDDIRASTSSVVSFSAQMEENINEIRGFLFEHMYRAPKVVEMRVEAAQIVRDLFGYFCKNMDHLPQLWRTDIDAAQSDAAVARIVCDYIAGMTDRFAIQCHRRFIDDPSLKLTAIM